MGVQTEMKYQEILENFIRILAIQNDDKILFPEIKRNIPVQGISIQGT